MKINRFNPDCQSALIIQDTKRMQLGKIKSLAINHYYIDPDTEFYQPLVNAHVRL
jgi:hypothetical protein